MKRSRDLPHSEIEDPIWLNPTLILRYSFISQKEAGDVENKVSNQRQQFINQVMLCDAMHIETAGLDAKKYSICQYVDSGLINYLEVMIALSAQTKILRDTITALPEKKKTLNPKSVAPPSSTLITPESDSKLITLIQNILYINRQAEAFSSESNFLVANKEQEGVTYFTSLTAWHSALGLPEEKSDSAALADIQQVLQKLIDKFEAIYAAYQNRHLPLFELIKKIDQLIAASEDLIHFMMSVLRLTVTTLPFSQNSKRKFQKDKFTPELKKRIQKIKPPPPTQDWKHKLTALLTDSTTIATTQSLALELNAYVLPTDKTKSVSEILIPFLVTLFTTPLKNSTTTAFDTVLQQAIAEAKKKNQRKEFIFILLHFLLSIQLEIPYPHSLLRKITENLYVNYRGQLPPYQQKIITQYYNFVKISYSSELASALKSVLTTTPTTALTVEQKTALRLRLDTAQLPQKVFDLKVQSAQLQQISPILGAENRKGADYQKVCGIIFTCIQSLTTSIAALPIKKDQVTLLIKDLQSLIDAEDQRIFSENPGIMVKLLFQFLSLRQVSIKQFSSIIEKSDIEFLQKLCTNLNNTRETELKMVTKARSCLADLLEFTLSQMDSPIDYINDLAYLLATKLNYTLMDEKDFSIKISPRVALDFLRVGNGFYPAMSYQDLIFNLLLALDRVAMRESSCFKEVPMIAELILQTLFLLGLEHLKQHSVSNGLQKAFSSVELEKSELRKQFGCYLHAVITQHYPLENFYSFLTTLLRDAFSLVSSKDGLWPLLFEYLFCEGGLVFLKWLSEKTEFNVGQARARLTNIHRIKMTTLVIRHELTEQNLNNRVIPCQQQLVLMLELEEKLPALPELSWSPHPSPLSRSGGEGWGEGDQGEGKLSLSSSTLSGIRLMPITSSPSRKVISLSTSSHLPLIIISELSSNKLLKSSQRSDKWEVAPVEVKSLTSLTEAVCSITGGQDLCDIVMQSFTTSMADLAHYYQVSSPTAISERPCCGWSVKSTATDESILINLVEPLLESCWQTYLVWDIGRANSEAQRKIGWLLLLPLNSGIKIKIIIKLINLRPDLELKKNIHILVQRMVNKFLDKREIRQARELIQLYIQIRIAVPDLNNSEIKDFLNRPPVLLDSPQILSLLNEWPTHEKKLNSRLLFIMMLPEQGKFRTTARNKAQAAQYILSQDDIHKLVPWSSKRSLKYFFVDYFQDDPQKKPGELIPEAEKFYPILLEKFVFAPEFVYSLLIVFLNSSLPFINPGLIQLIVEYVAITEVEKDKKDKTNKTTVSLHRASIDSLFTVPAESTKKITQDDCLNSFKVKPRYYS